MIEGWVIALSIGIGFGIPILICVLVACLSADANVNHHDTPTKFSRAPDNVEHDVAKLKFYKEYEFWRDYHKE